MMWSMMLLLSVVCGASGDAPREVWRFEALSNLYVPPLVEDMTDRPGREIIICDSEAGLVRCIDAEGAEVWQYDGGWAKRLISPAALSARDADGRRRLAIGNGDGSLVCLDAAAGGLLWRCEAAPVEWGGVLWARLGNDGEALVLGSEQDGVFAYNQDGEPVWHFLADSVTPPLHLRGPLTACDINGDGRDVLFGLSRFGPFALDADGALLWTQFTGDDFPGGPAMADADLDGRPETTAICGVSTRSREHPHGACPCSGAWTATARPPSPWVMLSATAFPRLFWATARARCTPFASTAVCCGLSARPRQPISRSASAM